ncbi:hypothetical protein LguiA_031760 [Lonicera macranthoides]
MRELYSVPGISRTPIFLPPSQAPSPLPLQASDQWFYFPIITHYNPSDLAVIALIMGMFLLSLLSLSFLLHLRVKSRWAPHLHKFNNLWSIRLLFILFISLWALNEMVKLPLFRQKYILPFCPSLTLTQQTNLCKFHVVLSLGLFEPGFLVTLLFLLNLSTKEGNNNNLWQIGSIFITILPVLLIQTLCVVLPPLEAHMPMIMNRSAVLLEDVFGNKMAMCTYPLFSCIIFAAFVISYLLGFVISCWRVMSFVINKGIKDRIHVLALSIMVALPVQILLLGLLAISTAKTSLYNSSLWTMVAIFLSVALCAAVGEVILVIKPISDALSVVGNSF